jgi:O-antigen ligase
LNKAHSATAISCTVLGAGLLLGARSQLFKRRVQKLEAWVAATVCLILLFQVTGVGKVILKEFSEAVGRDPKLHGRSEIWGGVLKEQINPLLGTGFYSFWSPERNERISKDLGFYYELGTAHNGYIETYLNSGILGLALLLAVLASALKGIKSQVLTGSGLGPLRLAFLVDVIVYNVTESAFDRLVPLWFALLLIVVEYRSFAARPVTGNEQGGDFREPVFASTQNDFSFHQVAATALA